MDSETILFPDFISASNYVHKVDRDWLLFASSRNISDFPIQSDAYGQHWIGDYLILLMIICVMNLNQISLHFLEPKSLSKWGYTFGTQATCMNIGCFVLHNNWISEIHKKLERQLSSGLWEYDMNTRMCLRSWQRFKPGCIQSLFGVRSLDKKDSRNRKEVKDDSFSTGNSLKSREFCVRIVHAGGKEDLYQNPVTVSQLVRNYPGMCFAWPEVFKNPNDSVLSATDLLLPGQKYYLIPLTTLKKLKKKAAAKKKKSLEEMGPVESDELVCSKDYYASKEKRSRRVVKKHIEPNRKPMLMVKKSKSKSWRGSDWEPSLTSIQELSP